MSIRKVAILEYAEGHIMDGDVLKPIIKQQDIMLTGTKRFHDCLYLILGVNKLQRVLMDWLSEEMDDKNMVKNDKYVRTQFINFVADLIYDGKKNEYKDQSVANAFHGLFKHGLLIQHSRMYYQVNPLYYWRGNDKDRIESIMMNIKFNSKETNFKVLNADKYEIRIKGK